MTVLVAVPPWLLLTVMFWGLLGQGNWPRPADSVPMNSPVDETWAVSVTPDAVLEASTRSSRLALSYSAREIVTLSALAGLTVSVALRVAPAVDAEIVTDVVDVTLPVVMVKLALVRPAGTVTLLGTLTTLLLLASATRVPPDGAGEDNVAVPVAEPPLVTVVGLTLKPDNAPAGSTVSVVVTVTPAPAAEIVTVVDVDGDCVLTENPPPPPCAGTVTQSGTRAMSG